MSPRMPDRHTRDDQVDFLLGLMCGLAAGAGLALLLAPASGRDTRRWVAVQGRAAGRRTGQILHTDQLTAIIRRSGILGLADMLRHTDQPSAVPTENEAPA
jgi:hypothetical protein